MLYIFFGADSKLAVAVSKEALLCGSVQKSEGGIHWMPEQQRNFQGAHWIKMALSNSVPLHALKKILKLFKARDVDVLRMDLDVLESSSAKSDTDTVSLLRLCVHKPSGAADKPWLPELSREIKRLKWLDDRTLDLAFRTLPSSAPHAERQEVGLVRAEVISTLSTLLYSLLSKQDVWAFSKMNIQAVVQQPRYLRHAAGIADLFIARFDPATPLPEARFKAWVQALRNEIELDVQEDTVAKEVLHRMVSTVESTLRTNLYMENRYALSLRLSSEMFTPGKHGKPFSLHEKDDKPGVIGSDTPYGVFYVHGRRFNGFHVRFRDIARGGLRLVTPGSVEQLAIESARHFDECYGLAYAQQMKNKDIPEGGSKCVVLVDTCSLGSAAEKDLVLRKSVKAFTDSMLDLIVSTPETKEKVVDLLGRQELVYLGPDEQVIPEDINWIVARAAQRGCVTPSAFMSSKPDAGINHKVYGVTSEGVQVFLDVALKELGIHPMQREAKGESSPFSVKMTGGPDGDVAGNMIKILHREYGDKVKVVGLADATGSAEDPQGLDIGELLRLVKESRPIADFNGALLSKDPAAALHVCDPVRRSKFESQGGSGVFGASGSDSLDAALRARNTMHNRVVSDAFIPAGGRPNTIHEGNWRAFLLPDGKPSSRLIVEGANLFLTAGARAALHAETGIPIVKDSSANKCGVICSSFEINSSMLLSHDEFLAIKPELVKDVVERLRSLAAMEAELLFREFRSLPGSLPHFSARISSAINRLTDAIAEDLDARTGGDYKDFMYLVENHLPNKLSEVARHRLESRMPKEYTKRCIASVLACKIVYQEGVSFVEQHHDDHLATLAHDYLAAEAKVGDVLKSLEALDWAGAGGVDASDAAKQMIKDGGIRSYLARHGNLEK